MNHPYTKNLLLICLLLLPSAAIAKKKFHIKPLAGIGIANMGNTSIKASNITSYKAEFAGGIQLNNLIVETGVGYMTTGYDLDGLTYAINFSTPGSTSRQITNNNNIYIPVRVTYDINIGRRFRLLPSMGIGPCFNTSTTIKDYFVEGSNESLLYSRDYKVTKNYLMGEASVYAGYALGNFTVVAGPAFKRMLKHLNGDLNGMPYQLTFDAGISCHF